MSSPIIFEDIDQFKFWSNTIESNGCLIWTGGRSGKGRGAFNVKGKVKVAARVALTITTGIDLEGFDAGHTCDNILCMRHLEWQTLTYNRGERGRWTICINGHPLTPENISYSQGRRRCHTCKLEVQKRYRNRK